MCLILFGFKVSKKYPLVLAANRDEFYKRPTQPMHFWENRPDLLAGKDLEQGGTWFGVTKKGRFAALTNFRDPASIKLSVPSRGEIITDFFDSNIPIESYGHVLRQNADAYNGYNLLFGSINTIYWFSNLKQKVEKLDPGIYGLSNRFLNTPWPKVETGKKALKTAIQRGAFPSTLFSILKNSTQPADHCLPDTGMGMEWERILSSLFIRSKTYGTRSSTLMIAGAQGRIEVHERTFSEQKNGARNDRKFSILPS